MTAAAHIEKALEIQGLFYFRLPKAYVKRRTELLSIGCYSLDKKILKQQTRHRVVSGALIQHYASVQSGPAPLMNPLQ